MPTFNPENPDFETAVRESFDQLALMTTIGASLGRVVPGEVDVTLPFRNDLTQHHGFMAVTELTAENTDQVVVKVTDGTLLLFPAYLQHSVDANASEHERVTISFNLMFSSFTENLSKPLW